MITRRSDALPVQMWELSKATFNELRNVPKIDFRPFVARFNFDSIIIDQYIGDAAYDLVIADCKGNELYRQTYVEIVDDVYQLSIVPQDVIPGLVDGMKVRFCIVDPDDEDEDAFDYSFDDSFHPSFPGMLYRSDLISIIYESINFPKIKYSNAEDYAGIEGYPEEEMIFELVVEARLFDRDQVETLETEEMDDSSVVALASSVKDTGLLEIAPAPDYFHKKIILALKHNTLTINGEYWVQEERYDKVKLNERCALKTASTKLTIKESDYFTNVYGPVTAEDEE